MCRGPIVLGVVCCYDCLIIVVFTPPCTMILWMKEFGLLFKMSKNILYLVTWKLETAPGMKSR
jgi:hypothetical protein